MSDVAGQTGDIYGSPTDWGLSKRKHAEMQAELSDHLYCLQAEEGIPAADAARKELSKPKTRRKLAGVHLTDQVYATLNRLPTKQEWRELIFLLVCFAVILLSDWLAYLAPYQSSTRATSFDLSQGLDHWVAIMAWFLQSLGRSAFFAGLAWSLWGAWRLGAGVMLARILQLKLIHTVMVVLVMTILGRALWRTSRVGHSFGISLNWPDWMNATVILAVSIILAVIVLLRSRRRLWAVSFGITLLGLFLFAGGPALLGERIYTIRLAWDEVIDESGQVILVPSTSEDLIAERAETIRTRLDNCWVDEERNEWKVSVYRIITPSGQTFDSWLQDWDGFGGNYLSCEDTSVRSISPPVVAAGAGIGWLAMPIPLLGLVGFIGLVLILGRRGPVEFAVYTVLCILALATTFLPFVYNCAPQNFFVAGFHGMITTPFPVIEDVLSRYSLNATWFMLVGGLVFSAGVPWLLTSLFLRPQNSVEPDLANTGEAS